MSDATGDRRPVMARWRWAAAGLLTIHAGLLGYLAVHYSPTVDEVGHLPAGLYTWEFGRFDVYRVNPPLVKTLATLPVWLAGPQYDWSRYRAGLTFRPEWMLGRDLMRVNGERSFRYFTWARWMLIPISLLGGIVCCRWARELYGNAAGLTALTLWCFSPTVLAYGSLITPDLGAAALGVTAGYTFWRWLQEPTVGRTILAGLTLGFVQLTKMTWIILFPLWPVLWIVWWNVQRRNAKPDRLNDFTRGGPRSFPHDLTKLAVVLMLGLFVLNMGYGFTGSFQRLGEYRFASRMLSGREFENGTSESDGNRFVGTWLQRVPIPFPREYVTGLDLQRRDLERGAWSYLRGEWKRGGWWWYYVYAAAIKEPLGVWCLCGMAAIAAITVPRSKEHWCDALILVLPAAMLFILVSSQTGMNRYVRYVLPAFPFAFIWASQAVRLIEPSNRWWVVPVGGALLWSVTSSLWIYPHCLSYFNEIAGGPEHGHQHLIDANIDWGQDLFALRDWLDAHPDTAPVRIACQAFVPLEILGIERGTIPDSPQPGWYVISRHDRHGRSGGYEYFDRLKPVDSIGGSMDVYHITPEQAETVRR